MQTRIRLGDGNYEITHGTQDGIPILAFVRLDEPRPVGSMLPTRQIPDDELTDRNAVVIEFPDFKAVDVLLYKVVDLWKESKEAVWDKAP